MKTRIFHTKFWIDPYIRSLAIDEKLFFFYLITNSYINILHFAEIPLDIISKETAIDVKRIQEIKIKFVNDGKIQTCGDYILLSNAYKYQYYKGIKNNYLKLRLIYELNDQTITYYSKYIRQVMFDVQEECKETGVKDDKILNLLKRVNFRLNDTGIPTPIYNPTNTGNKSEIINNKSETINQKSKTNDSEENYFTSAHKIARNYLQAKGIIKPKKVSLSKSDEEILSTKEDRALSEKFNLLKGMVLSVLAFFLFIRPTSAHEISLTYTLNLNRPSQKLVSPKKVQPLSKQRVSVADQSARADLKPTITPFPKYLTDKGAKTREIVLAHLSKYYNQEELMAADNILKKEAGYRYDAINEIGACGMVQAYPCEKLKCPLDESGIECQIQFFIGYINRRYGSPISAYKFHEQNNYY